MRRKSARRMFFEGLEARNLLTVGGLVDDVYNVSEDTALVVQPKDGVLANDTDVRHAALVSGPSGGDLIFNKNGGFGYQPHDNFTGPDTFVYKELGGDPDATATVTINVIADTSGIAAENDEYFVTHDKLLNVKNSDGVLNNDSGVTLASLATNPLHGRVTLHAKGGFVYQPEKGFAGTDTFTYIGLNQAGGADIAEVKINVTNATPVANDDEYTVTEDVQLTVPTPEGLLWNDTDADGDKLSIILVDGPEYGTLELHGDGNGMFIYTPNANYSGSDSFTYQVTDGIATSALATVTLTIEAVNDAPVAEDDAYVTKDIEDLYVPATEGVLLNDYDVDDATSTLTLTLNTLPDRGTLDFQLADGSFVYHPEQSEESYFTTFTYTVVDSGGLMDTATVTITVKATPIANDDSYEMLENTSIMGNVLDNDKNALGYVVVVNQQPDNGLLIIDDYGAFSYQPAADTVGEVTFQYSLDDGETSVGPATVTIIVREDIVTAAILNDAGFKTSDQLEEGDIDKAVAIAQDMNNAILDAVAHTGVYEDQNISVEDLFALNHYLIDNYVDTDANGDPIWVDGQGNIVPRDANSNNDTYYVGFWGDGHGDDAGGRLLHGYTGAAVEHGYHLIQNDGGTTTLDGDPGNYTLNSAGGGGQNFWTTVLDGIFHMGDDIVSQKTDGTYEFANEYQEGVDYFFRFLNEDGDPNASLDDVADWLNFLLV